MPQNLGKNKKYPQFSCISGFKCFTTACDELRLKNFSQSFKLSGLKRVLLSLLHSHISLNESVHNVVRDKLCQKKHLLRMNPSMNGQVKVEHKEANAADKTQCPQVLHRRTNVKCVAKLFPTKAN